ncbi:MAG: MBL fold metallo-hydrolase, partial [Hyphomicrobiaceae bacterium]|nr:MBL fold metallo-hydrolase [Hyphomicrobiaceae bacterium]
MASRLSRRGVLTALAATPVLGVLHSTALPRTVQSPPPLPPMASIRIGRFEVTALTDGYADMPYGYFTGRTAADIQRSAGAVSAARPTGLRLAFNQFLVRDGAQLVLIDTGPAGAIGDSGRLPAALAAQGVRPADIDAVVLTHLHVDHISGLVAGGRKVFANAEVYADRRDVAHWTDAAKR